MATPTAHIFHLLKKITLLAAGKILFPFCTLIQNSRFFSLPPPMTWRQFQGKSFETGNLRAFSLSRPLRDRMEIIPVAGYSLEDKLPIAKRLDCKKNAQRNFSSLDIFSQAPSSTTKKAARAGRGGRWCGGGGAQGGCAGLHTGGWSKVGVLSIWFAKVRSSLLPFMQLDSLSCLCVTWGQFEGLLRGSWELCAGRWPSSWPRRATWTTR